MLVTPVWAEPAGKPLGEQAESSLDAIKKASQYSFDTGGIGILIAFGTGNGVTAEQVGNAFVEEMDRRGMPSRYFYYIADWYGMTVEYHIRHSAMGPWGVDDAASRVSKAVARAEAAQRIHDK